MDRFIKSIVVGLLVSVCSLGAWAQSETSLDAPKAPAAEVAAPAPLPEPAPEPDLVPDMPEILPAPAVSSDDEHIESDNQWHHHRGREVVAIGRDVVVKKGETVREFVLIGGKGRIDGVVDGDVVVVGGSVEVNGRVDGDVVFVLTEARLGETAVIERDLVSVGGRLQEHDSAVVHGMRRDAPFDLHMPELDWLHKFIKESVLLARPLPPSIGWVWIIALVFFGLNFLLVLLMPGAVKASSYELRLSPVRSFFVGVLILVLSAPLALLLIVTGVGILVIPFVLAALFILTCFGKIAVYHSTGHQLTRQLTLGNAEGALVPFLAGTALFYLLYMVPFLGLLVWLLVLPMGLGAVVLALANGFRREKRTPDNTGPNGGGPVPPKGTPMVPPVAPPVAAAPSPTATSLSATTPLSPMTTETHIPAGVPSATVASSITPALPLGESIGSIPATPVSEVPPIAASTSPAPDRAGAASLGATAVPLPYVPPTPYVPPVDPLTGLSPAEIASLPRVGFWPRLGATALDFMLVGMVGAFTGLFAFFPIVWGAYHLGMWGWRGTTLGGIILGIRCIRLDGRPLDWPVATVRTLASFLSLMALGLGFFWASWNREHQSWHDMIAGTTIVKLPKRVPIL